MKENKQEKNAQFFIDYYNREKEILAIYHDSFDYKTDIIDYNEIIKTKALNSTIALIEETFDIHDPAVEVSTVFSVCLGTLAGGITAGATGGILSPTAALTATGIATAGTMILSEYICLKKNQAIKNYDKNAKKAAEMTQAVRNYRINDKSMPSEDVATKQQAPLQR